MTTLQSFFTALSALMVCGWLGVVRLRPAKIEAANIVAELKYGRVLRITSMCLALTPPTLLCILVWRLNWRDQQMLILAGSSLLSLGFIPGVLLIEVARTRVILTQDAVVRVSPWRATSTLARSAIKSVRFSSINRTYDLLGDGPVMRVSRMLDGVQRFIELAKAKIPIEHQGDLV